LDFTLKIVSKAEELCC